MPSDSDYMRDAGYGSMLEGEFPVGWGDDPPRSNRRYVEPNYFETFNEAKSWAQNNPGRTISRAPNGIGFIVKK